MNVGNLDIRRKNVSKYKHLRWWYFDRYVIRDGWIRPDPTGRLEDWDPWEAYEGRSEKHVRENAYVELINLAREIPAPPPGRQPLDLSSHQEERLLAWCSKNGLLGILPHTTSHVRMVKLVNGRPHITVMVRSSGPWFPLIRMPQYDDEPQSMLRSEAMIEEIGSDPRVEPLGSAWGPYFPGVPVEERETYVYPAPLTDEFWRQYAEPVTDFVSVAKYLADAAVRLVSSKDFPMSGYEGFSEGVPLIDTHAAISILGGLLKPVLLGVGEDADGQLRVQHRFPSLLAMLAMMVARDVSGKQRLYQCPCGLLFCSVYPEARFCSPEHREKYKKRFKRARAQ